MFPPTLLVTGSCGLIGSSDVSVFFARQSFTGDASPVFVISLKAGRNNFQLIDLDAPTVPVMPNGNTRHPRLGLHEVRIEPVQQTGGRSQ